MHVMKSLSSSLGVEGSTYACFDGRGQRVFTTGSVKGLIFVFDTFSKNVGDLMTIYELLEFEQEVLSLVYIPFPLAMPGLAAAKG